MRNSKSFIVAQPDKWRQQALAWADKQQVFAYTNPNDQKFPFDPFKEVLAIGALSELKCDVNHFHNIKNFYNDQKDWIFGYFGYDLKNDVETHLKSEKKLRTDHPDSFFFSPETLIYFAGDQVRIETAGNPENIFKLINSTTAGFNDLPSVNFKSTVSKEDYLQKAKKVIDHIEEGDVYELNLCMEFFAENIDFDPLKAYFDLVKISPTPFSGILKCRDNYLISASPERFLKKEGLKLISQPIKGTMHRSIDPKEDEQLKIILQNDEKERAENMMIVDLVRNDLTKSAQPGTINVDEIFGIYTFHQWHQMISTVTATAKPEIHPVEIIKNAFPMGSMTGAPKIKVMELIELYENSRRGVYSGAFGYFDPNGDFDFNVIIRSLLYSKKDSILNFYVGSALTYDAIPEKEYEECLLKASAIFKVFNSRTKF